MARFPLLVVALAGIAAPPVVARAAGSATSPLGVIDSRLSADGSAAVPLLEARSRHAAASEAAPSIDTASAIGTLIMFR